MTISKLIFYLNLYATFIIPPLYTLKKFNQNSNYKFHLVHTHPSISKAF